MHKQSCQLIRTKILWLRLSLVTTRIAERLPPVDGFTHISVRYSDLDGLSLQELKLETVPTSIEGSWDNLFKNRGKGQRPSVLSR